jgi:hypothetical protein
VPALAAGGERKSLPVSVRVFPFDMPEERHLMVTYWFTTGQFPKFHETGEAYSDRFFEVLGAYARNMAEHRQNVFRVDISSIAATREASALVRRLAPSLRRIDAIETIGFEGALEVWVPKLDHLYTWMDHYKQAQRAGSELWFYTCMHPRGAASSWPRAWYARWTTTRPAPRSCTR